MRGSSVVLAVVMAGLVCLFVLQSSFTLTGTQIAARDLGAFDYALELSIPTPATDRPGQLADLAAAASEAGAVAVTTELTSFDLLPNATYQERDWGSLSHPERFVLLEGRWPSAPGEAVATSSVIDDGGGSQLTLLSGLAQVEVVGVVEDRYARSASRVLAAPGTFASFDLAPISQRFTALDVRGSIFWSSADPEGIQRAVAKATPGSAGARLTSRAELVTTDRADFADSNPLAWRLPALALPFLCALVVFGAAGQRLRRTMASLRSVGVGPVGVTAAVSGAVVLVLAAAIAVGVVAGGLGALALRPVMERLSQTPLSPYPELRPALTLLIGMVVVACPVGVVWLGQRRLEPRRRRCRLGRASRRDRGLPTVRSVSMLRRFAATITAVVALGSSGVPLSDVAAATIWIGMLACALFLMTPEILTLCLRLVPTARPSGRLAHRDLSGHHGRSTVSVLLIAAAWSVPLAFATVLATLIQTDQADRVSNTAEGQVRILSEGGDPPPPEMTRFVSRELGDRLETPVTVWELNSGEDWIGAADLGMGGVFAVEMPHQLERLNSRALSGAQVEILEAGGILTIGEESHDVVELTWTVFRGGPAAAEMPAAPIDLDPVWAGSHVGVVLTSTAKELGLPLSKSDVVYTEVSDEDRDRLATAVATSGLDPYHLKIFQEPEPPRAPPAFYLALIALCGIVAGVVMFVVRAQATSLRRVLGSLVAVGVPASWARGVVFIELVVITAVAGVLAAVVAGPITAIAVARLPGFALSLPWGWLLLIVAACLASAVLGGLISTARLRPDDRFRI